MADPNVHSVVYTGLTNTANKNSACVTRQTISRVIYNGTVVYDASFVTLKFQGSGYVQENTIPDTTLYYSKNTDNIPGSINDSDYLDKGAYNIMTLSRGDFLSALNSQRPATFYCGLWKTSLVSPASGGRPMSYWVDLKAGGYVATSPPVHWGEDVHMIVINELSATVQKSISITLNNTQWTDSYQEVMKWDATVSTIPAAYKLWWALPYDYGTFIELKSGQTTTVFSAYAQPASWCEGIIILVPAPLYPGDLDYEGVRGDGNEEVLASDSSVISYVYPPTCDYDDPDDLSGVTATFSLNYNDKIVTPRGIVCT